MIEERRTALTKERDDVQTRIEAMKPTLVKATFSADAKKLEEIQRSLTELEAKKSALNTQLDLLSGPAPSCDDAYNAVEMAMEKKEALEEQAGADVGVIRGFCEDMMRPWKQLLEKTSVQPSDVDDFYLRRVRRH